MKYFTAITAIFFLSLSIGAQAEGGNYWEKKLEKIESANQKHDNPSGPHMDHSAVEHKRWQFDGADNNQIEADVNQPSHTLPKHSDHMAVDHKRAEFGGN
jgi:hypothetical protein